MFKKTIIPVFIFFLTAAAYAQQNPEVEKYIQDLKYGTADIKDDAIGSLGKIGPAAKDAVPALVQVLKDQKEDNIIRGDAALALGKIGPAAKDAVPALLGELKDEYSSVEKKYVVIALGDIGPAAKDAVPALVKVLKTEGLSYIGENDDIVKYYASVRKAAAKALGNIGETSSVPALSEASKDRDADVRSGAAGALTAVLKSIGRFLIPVLTEALNDRNADIRLSAANALCIIGPAAKDAVPALAGVLKDKNANVRQWAAFALGKIGPASKDAVPALTEVLKDKDANVRQWAAFALGEIGPAAKDAIPALIEALDEKAGVRYRAVVVLGNIGDTTALKALADIAKNDPGKDIRDAAKKAINDIKSRIPKAKTAAKNVKKKK